MNMPQAEPYEDVVLGSGAGGKLLAWHLARSGRRVAVVERRWVGGSCPNINCLPSKNEVWSAKVADLLHHAAQFGVVTGSVAVDMAKVRQRKREMVEGLVALHLDLYRKSGTELIMGRSWPAGRTPMSRTPSAGSSPTKGSRSSLRPRRSGSRGGPGRACASTCGRLKASGSSKAATSWPRRDAPPTPRGSDWTPS